MRKYVIFCFVLLLGVSCTKEIDYQGEQKEPTLYVIGDLVDTAGEENYIFVGETAFFSEGANRTCDADAVVRVMNSGGEWKTLSFNGVNGYGVSTEGMSVGDTMWVEVSSKQYETGVGYAVMPPHLDVRCVEFDTLPEDEQIGEDGFRYASYALLDLDCENAGDGNWYLNMTIEADMEYTYVYQHRVNGRLVVDTVTDTTTYEGVEWYSKERMLNGGEDIEEDLNIWELIFDDGSDGGYVPLVVEQQRVRAKVYLMLEEYSSEHYSSRCLALRFVSRVTSYDRYNYVETARAAQNSELNPFAEPTQLWNNVKSGDKNAGIFTITSVRRCEWRR